MNRSPREVLRSAGLVAILGGATITSTAAAAEPAQWARPQAHAVVRRSPAPDAARVGRLRFLTEDRQSEVYAVLGRRLVGDTTWLKIAIPKRPNGRTGWVDAQALGRLHVARDRLSIDRNSLRATLRRDGRKIWSARIGVGRPSLPTPKGHFYVREKLKAIGGSAFGPFAIGTSAYAAVSDWPGGGVVGIHGTDEPNLIPGRPSHGCVRLLNSDITRLWHLISVGTPIDID